MKYEIGKEYIFGSKEFIASRETGKLYFIIGENSSGQTYKVTPFDFQISDIPDQIVCVYKENDRFEQTLGSVLNKIYRVGDIYEFKVLRNNPMSLTLRDELNGITHNRISLPKTRLSRFDKIACRVAAIDGDILQLEYLGSRSRKSNDFFSPDDLLRFDYLKDKAWMRVAPRIMQSVALAEAREAIDAGESEWLLIAVNSILRYIPQWLSEAPGRRRIWLKRTAEALRAVAEGSRYIMTFPKKSGRGYKARERLAAAIQQFENYYAAARLVVQGDAEEMIEQTLQAMRESGWIYKPFERMGVMMGILSIAPQYSHSHISEIFEVIKTRRLNPKFLSMFGDSFRGMLKDYIENRRALLNASDRTSMRELAEAIAIELLLTADGEFDLWDSHRGLLYVISAIISGKTDGQATSMALRSFAGINDTPLEFGWDDLAEINRVCYHLLDHQDAPHCSESAVFEGEDVRIRIADKKITLSPAWLDSEMKPVFKRNVAGNIQFCLRLPSRLNQNTETADINLTRHHLLWNEISTGLHEKGMPVHQLKTYNGLRVNSEVEIIVTGQCPDNKFSFECVILGDENEAAGVLPITEIVPYPVGITNAQDIFCDDGKAMVLDAVVNDILPDGRFALSMKKFVMEQNAADARKDLEDSIEVLAMISDLRGTQYKATSDEGFGLLISKNEAQLEMNDLIYVRINNVNHRHSDQKLYINANFLEKANPAEDSELAEIADLNNLDFARKCLHELLKFLSNDRRHEQIPEPEAEEPDNESDDEEETLYLRPEAVADISMLLEQCAKIHRSDLVGCYTDLAAAKVLSEAVGDGIRSATLALKMRLQEKLSRFAKDGRLDLVETRGLLEECRKSKVMTHDMAAKMKIVGILAGLDNQAFLDRTVSRAEAAKDEHISRLRSLVGAYNMLEGLGIAKVRAEIKEEIFSLLKLPLPRIDKNRLSVSEDMYHEFKTSLIYPADNNMRADDRKQGEVIVQTLASFLNSDGGILYIGVDNAGYPKGLDGDFRFLSHGADNYDIREVQDKYNLMLQYHLRRLIGVTVDGLSLFPDFIRIEYEQIDNIWICRVIVSPFEGTVLFKDKRLFIRKEGEKNEIKDPKEYRRFIERRKSSK